MTPLNVFVTENNVDIFLSKLHLTRSPAERDMLFRLMVKEESKMGKSREHVENGERRVLDGRHRIEKHRALVAGLSLEEQGDHPVMFLLDTMEMTQRLLEEHLRLLRHQHQQNKL